MKIILIVMVVILSGCKSGAEDFTKTVHIVCGDSEKTYTLRKGNFSWDWDITITCKGEK